MESNIHENVVLYDWLSFTSKQHTPEQLIEALGLSHCPWTDTKGARGYMDRKYFGCISIHYNGREDMGVWCEMSGQGCRNFEDLSTLSNKWDDLIGFIHSNSLHMTRLDVAYDDHTGVLDIDQLAKDTEAQHFISRMNYWQVVRSSEGTSVQIGSPKSKVLVRIYDKAAERGFDDGRHWVRVELQMRDSRAEEFSKIPMPVGEAFAGVLLNYLRFVQPDADDSNKSRWETADYWYNLIGDVSRIKIFTVPGGAYNLERCKHYVFDMAGNAIDAMLQVYDSFDDFITALSFRNCKPNPKYELIVKEHRAREEAFAKKVERWFKTDDENETL
jgi:phage replication initiation protein